jgi:hypothetical protein
VSKEVDDVLCAIDFWIRWILRKLGCWAQAQRAGKSCCGIEDREAVVPYPEKPDSTMKRR